LILSPLTLPQGLSIQQARLGETETETTVTVSATREHPPGAVTVVLTARGKIAGAERWLAVPDVTLQIVRAPDVNPPARWKNSPDPCGQTPPMGFATSSGTRWLLAQYFRNDIDDDGPEEASAK
jgi:hypothetical protein